VKNAPFWIVDAFVGHNRGRILRGNPAAVVLLPEFAPDEELQERANEFNLSETAFLVPRGELNFDLRWMTPQVEVDLCGHATLAAAHALVDAEKLKVGQSARFSTRSGVLEARAGNDERLELDFPIQSVSARAILPALRMALGLKVGEVLFCGRAADDWLVRVHPETLQSLRVDFKKMALVEGRGVIVTTHAPPGASDYDFASRFFAPRVGVNEDPVTGSAHTKLAPFWAARLGKTKLTALQLSERGGLLELEVRGVRVGIGGRCHLRARGVLC